ncbi:MAG: ferrous iron transport protein A [Ruminococcaceae bacterium]|nr:ferrous iron transport protein A [Oscillospiraceae bacterium]
MTHHSLSSISIGTTVHVCALYHTGPIRRRLLDMGFTSGAPVTCLYQSPAGDPRAYLIRDTVIALRREETNYIEVM